MILYTVYKTAKKLVLKRQKTKKGGNLTMATKITDDCVACGVCEPECPVDAITEGDPIYVIDQTKCIDCKGHFDSPKCAEVCPTEACVPA